VLVVNFLACPKVGSTSVPELDRIREENREIKAILMLTNKRLDDVNTH